MGDSLDVSSLLNEADDLFNQNKFSGSYKLLKHLEESTNVEILWRLARTLFYMAEETPTQRKEYFRHGYRVADRALSLDENHYAVHKWYAILLHQHEALNGIKAMIKVTIPFKEHMLKAIQLNPKDAHGYYCLGEWCFAFADFPWYQRQIASALFATPPTSTFQEALDFYLKAEQTEPNFSSANLMKLGKTYLRLKTMDKAVHYLLLAAARPTRNAEDERAKEEAENLLKQNKAKK